LCQPATTNPPVSAEVPPNCTLTSLTTVDGVYTVNTTTGEVEFNPASTFSGTVANPINYQVTDSINRTITSTITPTIGPPPGPTAAPDTSTGNYDTNQTIDPLANDPDNPAIPLLPATLKLCGINPIETPNNCTQTSLFVPGEGSYVLDPATGLVTFDPLPTFSGTATPIKYQAANDAGQVVNSTITVTVGDPPLPVAKPDSSSSAMRVVQTINPLGNDTAGVSPVPLDPTTVKLCGIDPVETPNDCTKTTLIVPGKGTFSVDPVNGLVSFTPLDTFNGTVPPINYTVADTLAREVSSQINIVVLPPPAMAAITDLSSGNYNTPQTITPLTNDSPGDLTAPELSAYTVKGDVEKDPTSVRFCGTDDPATTLVDESVSPNCVATSITTAAGTYVVNTTTGVVTFTPVATFTGTDPNAPTYQTCNKVTGTWEPGTPPDTCASALIIPTVGEPPLPIASPDTSTGNYDTNQTINPLSNDTANENFPLDQTTLKLCGAGETLPNCSKTTLTVLNEGTYTVDPITGVVIFDPLPSFTGAATPISYQVSDSLGREVTSTISVTVGEPPLPTAANDTNSGPFDTDQIISPLTNDSPIAAFPFDQTTVKLCATGISPPNCDSLRVETADGVYTVNPDGTVTFNPDPDFTGVATSVTYQVTETKIDGRTASATITPTVGPPPLATATPDAQTSAHDTNQTYTPTSNDTANAFFPISPTSVKLCATGENPPTCTATTLTVANEGTYTIDPNTGVVTFDPLPSFTGVATPITYQASDLLDRVVNSTITPTIREPQAVTVLPDTSSDAWDVTQTKSVLANDTPGSTAFPFLANTVKICDTNEVYPNCSKSTVTIANQGTYTVNSDGTISFDPLPTFFGTATPIKYQAGDGKTTDWSTYTPTVEPPPAPIAQPDVTSGAMGKTQTINLLTNASGADSAGISGVTLDPTSVKLCGEGEASPNCAQTTVAVAGVGTYSVSNGVMTFTPEANFTGTPAPLAYTVLDSTGQKASSTYTPTVIPPPTVVPDTTTAGWDVTQSMDVVTGVTTKGSFDESLNTGDSAAEGATLVAGSLRLCSLSDIEPDCTVGSSGSVVIPNQGTYTVDPTSGFITFDPLPTFIGTAMPVTYSVTDDLGQKSSTTYTPTVVVPVPVATPEVKKATLVLVNPSDTTDANLNFGDMQWTTIFTSVLEGNGALATGSGLESGTTNGPCLIDPVTSVCSASVTIPGEGIYNMDQTTGVVTFVSEVVVYDPSGSNITPGPKTAISYRVTDSVGQTATSTLTPIIPKPPVANPDFSTGVQGAIQTISPVGNDRPGGGASTELYPDERTEKPSGIYLCAANQPPPDCRATTVEVIENDVLLGTLTVADSGLVTFTPEPDFVGTTPPIGYQIPDNLGQKAYSTIIITVVPPPAPSATIDTGSAEYNQPVTLRPWINDAPGTRPDNSMRSDGTPYPAPNLVATSIKLCDDNSTFVAMSGTPADCTATKIKTVEGTYEVNATTGEVVFTPVNGFTGTVKYPPTYQIWNDWTGLGGAKSATALLVPTIAPPGAPAANVDVTKTKPGTSVVLNPVSNDKPGSYALDPTTIRLCGTGEISPACTQMSVTTLDGLYVVDPTSGQVTFTPRDGFTGQATIPYVIHDARGMAANSHLIITVEDTAVVPVVKKTKVGLAKTGGTRPDLLLLLGLVAIAAAGGLRVLGRKK
jgi:CshA-type fibril repeat protein